MAEVGPDSIRFFVGGHVASAQQKGTAVVAGHVHHFVKPHVKVSRERIMTAAREVAPKEPWDGPLLVRLCFWRKCPQSPSWLQEAANAGAVYHEKRPDLDNQEKLTLDALEGIVYLDDAQIAKKLTEKKFAPRPELVGVTVLVRRLPQVRSAAEWKAWQKDKR